MSNLRASRVLEDPKHSELPEVRVNLYKKVSDPVPLILHLEKDEENYPHHPPHPHVTPDLPVLH